MGLYNRNTVSWNQGDRENGTKWSKAVGLLLFYRWNQRLPSCKHLQHHFKQEERMIEGDSGNMRLPLPPQAQAGTGPGHKAASAPRAGPLAASTCPAATTQNPGRPEPRRSSRLRPEGGTSSQRGGSPVLSLWLLLRSWTSKTHHPFLLSSPLWSRECLSYAHPVCCILEAYFGFLSS